MRKKLSFTNLLQNGILNQSHEIMTIINQNLSLYHFHWSQRIYCLATRLMLPLPVKHPKEKWFYIYDSNYYVVRDKNKIDEKLTRGRLTFSPSSVGKINDFVVINRDTDTGGFQLMIL